MLEAFFGEGSGNLRETRSGRSRVEDTEVPVQDIRDVSREASRLRRDLENLQAGGTIDVENAKRACYKMVIFDIPKEVTEASAKARGNASLE